MGSLFFDSRNKNASLSHLIRIVVEFHFDNYGGGLLSLFLEPFKHFLKPFNKFMENKIQSFYVLCPKTDDSKIDVKCIKKESKKECLNIQNRSIFFVLKF